MMTVEKLEECPICGATLDQVEYDMQTHANHWLTLPPIFFHATPKPEFCDHDFQGWREFPESLPPRIGVRGRLTGSGGGERVCAKCGIGAMEHSLRTGP